MLKRIYISSEISYPEGVTVAESTMDKTLKEEMTKMGNALFMAVVLVFLVMAIQFESVRFSLMVMACIPLFQTDNAAGRGFA